MGVVVVVVVNLFHHNENKLPICCCGCNAESSVTEGVLVSELTYNRQTDFQTTATPQMTVFPRHWAQTKQVNNWSRNFDKRPHCRLVLFFLDRVSDSMDSGTAVEAIYLDFAEAFDKAPHGRLLRKLEKYGISGQLLQWIKAWLCGRSQKVCLEGTVSDWVAVISGVLGPLLFLIYIND